MKHLLFAALVLLVVFVLSPEAGIALFLLLAVGLAVVVHPLIAAILIGTPLGFWRRRQRKRPPASIG